MSTCSTATSARRLSHDDDAEAGRELETRLRDLERDWRAYKSSRSAAPRRRCSAAGGSDEDLSDFLRCSPRRLVYSPDSGADDSSAGAVVPVKRDSCGRRRRHGSQEEDASSVGSVKVKDSYSASSASSCSCPRHRAALRRRTCSTSSSRSIATDDFSPPAARSAGVADTEEERATKAEGESSVTGNSGRVKRLAAIALVVLVVVGVVAAMMMAGHEEFLVPT